MVAWHARHTPRRVHLLGNDVYKAAEGLIHPGNSSVKTRREMCVNGID